MVFQGVSRGAQWFSGCSRMFPEVHRGFQGVSRGVQGFIFFFRKKTFTFNLYYKTRQRLLQNAAALLDDPCIAKRGKGQGVLFSGNAGAPLPGRGKSHRKFFSTIEIILTHIRL